MNMADEVDQAPTVPGVTTPSPEPHIALKGYKKAPVPCVEKQCPDDLKWVRDYYDDAIPSQKGFITDMIFHSRGYETPTLSVIWTALFVLSSAIKREAWFKWTPKYLFSNQYIIIIGPAGVVKKTTAIVDIGFPILKQFRSYIQDPQFAEMKHIHTVKDKITPEAMIQGMLPENKEGTSFYLKDENGEHIEANGKAVKYNKTSETAIVISELSVFLSKSTYQSEMIQILLDLYECKDEWDYETKGGGKKKLRNLHTGMFGATTVDGLRNSLPPSAKGDGFLSRTILVHVPDTKRVYRRPFIPRYAPSTTELAKRLAWIAENTIGEYDLSPAADAYMEEWYQFFSKKKRENPAFMAAWSRMDINVYKTALLMRAQRYNCDDKIISIDDVKNAIRLLDLTYSSFPFLMSQISSDDFVVATSTIEHWLGVRKKATRVKMLQSVRINSEIASWALTELVQRGAIKVWFGDKESTVQGRSTEVYEWLGVKDDGAAETGEAGTGENINYTGSVWVDPPDGDHVGDKPRSVVKVHEKNGDKEGPKKGLDSGKAKSPSAKGRARPMGKGPPGRKAPSKRKKDN
jgi:hypothetical protein